MCYDKISSHREALEGIRNAFGEIFAMTTDFVLVAFSSSSFEQDDSDNNNKDMTSTRRTSGF